MSKPKFMVFKLKDLWIPAIITIFIIMAIIFFITRQTQSKPTFAPDNDYSDGIYLSNITLDNAEFCVAVSINKNLIESIKLQNLTEQDELMYPLFPVSMEYINNQVTKKQSLDIEDFPQATETTRFLISAVKDALSIKDNNDFETYIVKNPEMSEDAYSDWESEIDFMFEDELELDIELE